MPADDKAGTSKGARSRSGRRPRQKRNLMGTEEEVQGRNFESGMFLWNPAQTFPEFKQIKPDSVTGKSVTTAGFKDLSMKGLGEQTFKFSGGFKKPTKS